MWRATALVLTGLLTLACTGPSPAAFAPGAPGDAVVTDVVDGDTLDVDLGAGAVERVRLIGIDTPESVDPDRPVECHGPEAAALLAALVPPGTPVRLERDEEPRDRYGRLLAYVFRLDDDLFVNEAVAAAGEAEILEIPPNTAYGTRLRAVVGASRAAGTGLWGECGVPP